MRRAAARRSRSRHRSAPVRTMPMHDDHQLVLEHASTDRCRGTRGRRRSARRTARSRGSTSAPAASRLNRVRTAALIGHHQHRLTSCPEIASPRNRPLVRWQKRQPLPVETAQITASGTARRAARYIVAMIGRRRSAGERQDKTTRTHRRRRISARAGARSWNASSSATPTISMPRPTSAAMNRWMRPIRRPRPSRAQKDDPVPSSGFPE